MLIDKDIHSTFIYLAFYTWLFLFQCTEFLKKATKLDSVVSDFLSFFKIPPGCFSSEKGNSKNLRNQNEMNDKPQQLETCSNQEIYTYISRFSELIHSEQKVRITF
jgi:hypothetical protein